MSETTPASDQVEQAPADADKAAGPFPTVDTNAAKADVDETDWKALSRKHEGRSKENLARAETAEARVKELETELADAKSATLAAVREVMVESAGLDKEAATLLTADTVEGLTQQFNALRKYAATASSPLEGTGDGRSKGDPETEFARNLFRQNA